MRREGRGGYELFNSIKYTDIKTYADEQGNLSAQEGQPAAFYALSYLKAMQQ